MIVIKFESWTFYQFLKETWCCLDCLDIIQPLELLMWPNQIPETWNSKEQFLTLCWPREDGCGDAANVYFMVFGKRVGVDIVVMISRCRYSDETWEKGLSVKWILDILVDFLLLKGGFCLPNEKLCSNLQYLFE